LKSLISIETVSISNLKPSIYKLKIIFFFFKAIKTSAFYKASKDLPLCSNQTLTTSPPIYEFTTLEPLPTDFYRSKSTANEKEVTDGLTTDMDSINNLDNEEMEATSEESIDFSSEQPEYDENKGKNCLKQKFKIFPLVQTPLKALAGYVPERSVKISIYCWTLFLKQSRERT